MQIHCRLVGPEPAPNSACSATRPRDEEKSFGVRARSWAVVKRVSSCRRKCHTFALAAVSLLHKGIRVGLQAVPRLASVKFCFGP